MKLSIRQISDEYKTQYSGFDFKQNPKINLYNKYSEAKFDRINYSGYYSFKGACKHIKVLFKTLLVLKI